MSSRIWTLIMTTLIYGCFVDAELIEPQWGHMGLLGLLMVLAVIADTIDWFKLKKFCGADNKKDGGAG